MKVIMHEGAREDIYIYINMWRVIMNIVVVWAFEERVSLLIWVGMVVWSI